MQESDSPEWGLWDGPIHVLELSQKDFNLDTIWDRFEEFCKLQSNEVRAYFDLLTSFCQGNKSMDEWYNTIQSQVNLAKYCL